MSCVFGRVSAPTQRVPMIESPASSFRTPRTPREATGATETASASPNNEGLPTRGLAFSFPVDEVTSSAPRTPVGVDQKAITRAQLALRGLTDAATHCVMEARAVNSQTRDQWQSHEHWHEPIEHDVDRELIGRAQAAAAAAVTSAEASLGMFAEGVRREPIETSNAVSGVDVALLRRTYTNLQKAHRNIYELTSTRDSEDAAEGLAIIPEPADAQSEDRLYLPRAMIGQAAQPLTPEAERTWPLSPWATRSIEALSSELPDDGTELPDGALTATMADVCAELTELSHSLHQMLVDSSEEAARIDQLNTTLTQPNGIWSRLQMRLHSPRLARLRTEISWRRVRRQSVAIGRLVAEVLLVAVVVRQLARLLSQLASWVAKAVPWLGRVFLCPSPLPWLTSSGTATARHDPLHVAYAVLVIGAVGTLASGRTSLRLPGGLLLAACGALTLAMVVAPIPPVLKI